MRANEYLENKRSNPGDVNRANSLKETNDQHEGGESMASFGRRHIHKASWDCYLSDDDDAEHDGSENAMSFASNSQLIDEDDIDDNDSFGQIQQFRSEGE